MNTACLLLGAVSTVPFVFLAVLVFVLLVFTVIITIVTHSNKSGVALGLTLLGVLISLFCFVFTGYFILAPQRTRVGIRPTDSAQAFGPAAPVPPPVMAEDPFDATATEDTAVSSSAIGIVDELSSTSRSWDPWDRVVEDTLRANVYCSLASAERALARECLSQLGPHLAENPKTVSVIVNPLMAAQRPWLGSNLDGVIRESFPLATVQRPDGRPDSPNPENEIVLVIDLPKFQLTDASALGTEASGSVSLRGTYGDHLFEGTKRFTEKLWVSRFEEFVNRHPQRTLLRANCASFATDEATAYEDAVDVAVRTLLPRAVALLSANPDGRAMAVASQPAVRQQLRAAIERNELVADRFSQQLESSSGMVWRATLLLDYQPTQLMQLANQGLAFSESEQRSRIVTGLAVALMFGLVVALYLVVNELTKGYFVWNLRAAAMLALLSIVVAVCWWIR